MQSGGTQEIGRYAVDRKIGSGGMAETYRCRAQGLGDFDQWILAKVLHASHAADASQRRMFMEEARLVAQLSHPSIPHVFELGEHEGRPYMMMEYVDGPNLVMVLQKLRDGFPHHYGHMAHIFVRVAEALHHAHGLTDSSGQPLQIVHRDVSLANILIGRHGHTKLIDFGIAASTRGGHDEETTLRGKRRYMAPEQLAGRRLDARTDVYQAGVALYWFTVGTAPYAAEALRAGTTAPPVRPSDRRGDYPAGLEAIVMRCLASDPEDRYASAGELAEALAAFTRSTPALRSSDEAVARWIQTLFTPVALASFHGRASDAADVVVEPTTATHDLMEKTRPVRRGRFSEPISRVGWAGLIFVAAVAAWMSVERVQAHHQALWAQEQALRQSASEALGKDLLEQVDRALAEGDLLAARQSLSEFRRISKVSSRTRTRGQRLDVAARRAAWLHAARRAMQRGAHAESLAATERVLELQPSHREAQRLAERATRYLAARGE